MEYFIKTFERSLKKNWDNPAITEFRSSTITYAELAEHIETIHLYFRKAGLKIGDKVAINARSSLKWAETFMASVSGGYTASILFNGYTPADTQRLVCHSDSRILFTEKAIYKYMDF